MTESTHRQRLVSVSMTLIGLMLGALLSAHVAAQVCAGGAEGSGFSGAGVVNVRDFGALGDGINADSLAIQAAIDAAEGGIVFMPKGTYRLTETLVIAGKGAGTTIYGTGDNTVLLVDAAIDALRVSSYHVRLYNFTVDGNHRGLNGIVMHNGGRSMLEKLIVTNFTRHGVLFDTDAASPPGNNNLTKLLYTTTNFNDGSGVAVSQHQRDNNGLEFIGIESRRNGATGLLYKGQGCRVIGGIFEHNISYGIQLSERTDGPYTTGCIILHPWLEGNGRGVCNGLEARCGIMSAGRAVRNIILRDTTVQGLTSEPGSEEGEILLTNSYGAMLQFRGANNRSINLHPRSNASQAEIYPDGPDASMALVLAGKNNGGVVLGWGGTPIQKHVSGIAPWSPPELAANSYASTEVFISDAVLGSTCHASFSQPLPDGVTMSAAVTAPGIVKVTLVNHSRETKSLTYGAVRVDVWIH